MPYFCVVCGMFQRHDEEKCPDCGAKSERATRIDLLNQILKKDGGDESIDEFPEEIVSRSSYLWFKITRPWRRLWRRGLLWRFVLITGSSVIASIPIIGAIYWYDQIRCDPEQTTACIATVVSLATPISEEFSTRVNETLSDHELALSAEVYDSVVLLALAWLDDQAINPREVVEISSGDFNICTSAMMCATDIQNGINVDYDGASGSVYFSPEGDRGTYLKDKIFHKKLVKTSDPTQLRLFGSVSQIWDIPDDDVKDTVIKILSKRDRPGIRQALAIATADLQDAGISIQISWELGNFEEVDEIGNYLVVVDSGLTDETLSRIASADKVVVLVGSEWRRISDSVPALRLSADPDLLAELVLPELRKESELLVVGRCGDQSLTFASALQKRLSANKVKANVQTDCVIEKPTDFDLSFTQNQPRTLIIATSYNPIGLFKTLLQAGYTTKAQNVIVIGEMSILSSTSESTSPKP